MSRVVELAQTNTAGGQFIEIRSLDFAAETSDIGPTHVIGHDDDDVGSCRLRSGQIQQRQDTQQANCHQMIHEVTPPAI